MSKNIINQTLLTKYLRYTDNVNSYIKIFKYKDIDNNGTISKGEAKDLFKGLNDNTRNKAFSTINVDNNNQIDIYEFLFINYTVDNNIDLSSTTKRDVQNGLTTFKNNKRLKKIIDDSAVATTARTIQSKVPKLPSLKQPLVPKGVRDVRGVPLTSRKQGQQYHIIKCSGELDKIIIEAIYYKNTLKSVLENKNTFLKEIKENNIEGINNITHLKELYNILKYYNNNNINNLQFKINKIDVKEYDNIIFKKKTQSFTKKIYLQNFKRAIAERLREIKEFPELKILNSVELNKLNEEALNDKKEKLKNYKEENNCITLKIQENPEEIKKILTLTKQIINYYCNIHTNFKELLKNNLIDNNNYEKNINKLETNINNLIKLYKNNTILKKNIDEICNEITEIINNYKNIHKSIKEDLDEVSFYSKITDIKQFQAQTTKQFERKFIKCINN